MAQLLLALDFGGTKHTAAVALDGERQWRTHQRILSPPHPDMRSDLEAMRALAREVLAGERPAAVGVSFGGPVDASTGTVRLSNHVPGWENVPLREMLEAEFGAPVRVENDANAAALGEHHFGAGRGHDSLLYITVSTGVGGGWILNGQLWRGAQGMAGEIGHTVVDPDGPLCLCGKRGCLERLASGQYIAQRARNWLAGDSPDFQSPGESEVSRPRPGTEQDLGSLGRSGDILRALAGENPDTITARMVAEAAARRDDLAWRVLEVAARALGLAIGNTANLINPQRFVLGGGVTHAGERFWEAVRRVARETALPEILYDIVPAALGDDAPLWGAVILAKDCLPIPFR